MQSTTPLSRFNAWLRQRGRADLCTEGNEAGAREILGLHAQWQNERWGTAREHEGHQEWSCRACVCGGDPEVRGLDGRYYVSHHEDGHLLEGPLADTPWGAVEAWDALIGGAE